MLKISRKLIIKILISVIFLTIIFLKIDIPSLLQTIASIKLWGLLILLPLVAVHLFLNTFNIYILLKSVKVPVTFRTVLNCYISAWLFGKVSTGKTGELSIVYFLTKEKVKIHKTLFAVVLDKIITLFLVIPIALLAALYIFKDKGLLILLILGVFITLGILSAIFYKQIFALIKKYLLRSYSKYFKGFTKNLNRGIKKKRRYILLNLLSSVLKLFNITAFYFIIFMAFGHYISPHIIFLVSILEGTISLIPISFSNIGVSEGVGIVLYNQVNVASHIVLPVYFFFRLFNYACATIIFLIRGIVTLRK